MRRDHDGHTTYDESTDESQGVELDGPDLAGFYTSQLHDWIPLSPYLSDSAVRLYWIMRALVIEKHGPVRKLTLLQLAYMLPRKPVAAGEKAEPSGLGRIRDLMRMLTRERLLTTPEGEEIKTSSRASAASRPLRIRIHDRPASGYDGPRNAFALLDAVKGPAAEAARQAIAREAEQKAQKRARKAEEAPGWISNPPGWISNPPGWISNPDPGTDLQDRVPPLSPPAQSLRSHHELASVRPSVQVVDADVKTTDGRTDGGGGDIEDQEHEPAGAGGEPATAGAAPEKSGSNGGGAGSGPSSAVRPVDLTPGVEVLRAIAAEAPEWTITHAASLRDQGRTATGMLDAGFSPQEIRHAILARPLPQPLRTTVAAVVSRRLRDLIAVGPSAGVQPIPAQQSSGTYDPFRRATDCQDDEPTPTPASWAERRAQMAAEDGGQGRYRPCASGDGMTCPHDALPGRDLCASCLGGERPTCANGCGKNVVAPGCMCITCAAPPAVVEMGDCPGYGGQPCGRAVVTEGLCARHKIDAERDRAAAEAEWEAARDAAVAAAQAAEPAPL
ncbi:hypothetical protein GTY86_27865 [Streptomyces sp. SID5770]|uniref:hypothetical protein n=1 Tax=Streptomyces sp. SID5770 TaxID=2690308 RepID=UPI00136B462C|nr:hypothetical protein [Streptomyces sp. SID5770]MZE55026.1 hypothetical protein [Streptomyces sp. SID5770]